MSCPLTVAICRVFGKKSSNKNCGLVRAGFFTYFSMGSYQPAFRKRSPSQEVRLMKPSTEPEPDTISTASFWRNWSSGKISHATLMPVSCSNSGSAGRMISLVQSWLLTRKRICLPLNRFQSNVPWAVTGDGAADIHRRLAPKSAMRVVAMTGRGDLSIALSPPETTARRAVVLPARACYASRSRDATAGLLPRARLHQMAHLTHTGRPFRPYRLTARVDSKHVPVGPIPPRSAGTAGMLVGDGARRRRLRDRSADGPAFAVGPGLAPFGQRHARGDHSAASAVLRERPALRPVEPVSIAGGEHVARHALELDQHALELGASIEPAERPPGARP